MPIPKVSDKDFVRVFEEHGPMETARRLGKAGSSMAIDPLSAVAGVGSALTSAFGGDKGLSGNVQKHLAREGLNKQGAPIAASLSAKLATMPLADRAAYLLAQRLTPGVMSAQNFQPHDLFNQSTSAATPQYSMTNQSALADLNRGYQPGQGGFDPGVIQQALANLGSSSDQSYATTAGSGTPWGATQFDPQQTEKDVHAQQAAANGKKALGFVQRILGR